MLQIPNRELNRWKILSFFYLFFFILTYLSLLLAFLWTSRISLLLRFHFPLLLSVLLQPVESLSSLFWSLICSSLTIMISSWLLLKTGFTCWSLDSGGEFLMCIVYVALICNATWLRWQWLASICKRMCVALPCTMQHVCAKLGWRIATYSSSQNKIKFT